MPCVMAPNPHEESQQLEETINFKKRKLTKPAGITKQASLHVWVQIENKLADRKELLPVAQFLCQRDCSLSPLIAEYGLPQLERQSVFPSLMKAIVSQQLSGKAAKAITQRLQVLLQDTVTPVETARRILDLEETQLRQSGLSKRKSEYLKGLAQLFVEGTLQDEKLASLSDDQLMSRLLAVRGVGEWTVHMLMIFALQREDVLPSGDLGVRKGAEKYFGWSSGQQRKWKKAEWEAHFDKYRPYRTYVSWLLWKVNSPQFVIAMQEAEL